MRVGEVGIGDVPEEGVEWSGGREREFVCWRGNGGWERTVDPSVEREWMSGLLWDKEYMKEYCK